MKIILPLLLIITTNLYTNENWIKIEPINTTQTPTKEAPQDVNLSQIEPVNKMLKNDNLRL